MVKKISVAAALAATLLAGASAAQAQSLNPAPMCAVSPTTFSSWQATSGYSTKTLSFLPPNSATFQVTQGDCSFYQWSSQMFLWLTSTDSSGNMVLFSKSFYNAVEDPTTGNFTFVPNTATPAVANGPAKPKLQILTRVNKPVPKAIIAAKQRKLAASPNGGTESSEASSTGQADGGVLLLKGEPIANPANTSTATYPVTYYSIHVNDVFVGLQNNQATVQYYKNGPNQGNFPITAGQVTDIATAAKTTYADANQLTLEIKNSWVDIAYLTAAQSAGLITMQADVPAFTQTKSTDDKTKGNLELVWDGKTTVTRTLALVGMHVVGTVAGHPEMVWATFESDFNSPDATYSFINNNFQNGACPQGQNCLSTVAFSTSSSTPSIFYTGKSGAAAPPEPIVTTAKSGSNNTTITSTSTKWVPTNVARLNPWGNRQPTSPSLTDPVVINNTQLLSLETSLNSALTGAGKNGPILANYKQVGAVWTNGTIPGSSATPPDQDVALAIGSVYLANTTMETFQQSTASNPTDTSNCFTCHQISPGTPGVGVSHVFTVTSTSSSN